MLPLLLGASVPWRDAFLYEYYEYPAGHCARKNRGIRTERCKLIHFFEQLEEWELYDLREDPDETKNLARSRAHASTMTSLQNRMSELRKELGDSDPPGPRTVSPAAPTEIAGFTAREDAAAVVLAIGRPAFRPDCRWLASVAGISIDRVNIVLQALLRGGGLRMSSPKQWEVARERLNE